MTARRSQPWEPFDYTGRSPRDGTPNLPKAVAIQALAEGTASEHQQRLALTCIVEDLCQYHDLSYSPDSTHDTAFAEGKRWVGASIAKLTRLNYSELKRRSDKID